MSRAAAAARGLGLALVGAVVAGMAVLAFAGDGDPTAACRASVYRDPVSGRQAATGRMDAGQMRRCLAVPRSP